MILAKDLIILLEKFNPMSEVVVYEGERSGLHVSISIEESYGWIEVGDNEKRIMLDDPNHQIKQDT